MNKLWTIIVATGLLAAATVCMAGELEEASLRVLLLQERQTRLDAQSVVVKMQTEQNRRDLTDAVEQYKAVKAKMDRQQAEAAAKPPVEKDGPNGQR